MKHILILILLVLSGCTVKDKMSLAKGEQLCKDYKGLYEIQDIPLAENYEIFCKNGHHILITYESFQNINGDVVAEEIKKSKLKEIYDGQ